METVAFVIYIIAGILMLAWLLLNLSDAVMERRRKKELLDRLDEATAMLSKAIAEDLAEAEKHVFIVTEKDFEDDGK